jgi:hypothetical protein
MREKRRELVLLAVLSLPVLGLSAPEAAAAEPGPVAVVTQIEGKVMVVPAKGGPARVLARFDRLAPGAVLRTSHAAELVVTFTDGSQFAVKSSTWATLLPDGFRVRVGDVLILPPVPAAVALAPLERNGTRRRRSAAVRIRFSCDGCFHGRSAPELISSPPEPACERADVAATNLPDSRRSRPRALAGPGAHGSAGRSS